ncbi:hypothetical protein Clacol_009440 [Clathrus columnatus]|uniref:intramembrane prenyl-peptidase Rce1 n=1 Tax=Clathrus columnatus TaxID=1419009 RepID=A0AAV5AL64_9AGAM|nr:hypothetical protein Clacol_009440 [Clathrus columnatus]
MALLSSFQAFCISTFISVSYVAGLYISKSARISYNGKSIQRDRDNDEVIRARLKAVYLSTCLNCAVIYWCMASDERAGSIWTTLKALGFVSSKSTIKAHFLIPILYTGPFVAQYLSKTLPFQANWSLKEDIFPIFTTWIGFRNYIAAPISEEIVFRACLLTVARMSQKGWYQMLFATPLWFGFGN